MLFPKRSLTLKEIEGLSTTLALMALDFRPDVVVSIKTGGWYVGEIVSHALNLQNHSITICRENDKDPHGKCSDFKKIISIIRRLFGKPSPLMVLKGLDCEGSLLKNKKVLVVDDAVHSGKTLALAYEYLGSFEPSQLKSAVVGNVHSSNCVDYYIYDGVYCYPWSRISKQYKKFLLIYNAQQFKHI